MKQLTSILILCAILLQISGRMITLLGFETNRHYIASNLCENKNRPQLHCNGKCHLAKQLKQQERQENAPVNAFKDKFEIYNQGFEPFVFFFCAEKNTFSPFIVSNSIPPSPEIFQPPKV